MKRLVSILMVFLTMAVPALGQIMITRQQAVSVIAKCDSLDFYRKYAASSDSIEFQMGKQIMDGKTAISLLKVESATKDTLLFASQKATAHLSGAIRTRNYIIAGLGGIALLASIICVFSLK